MNNAGTQADPTRAGHTGRLLIVSAALLWSTSGFFAKAPLFADWPVEVRGPLLAFWRSLFAGLVLLPFVRRPQRSLKLIPMVLVFGAMNFTYLSAMAHTTAANAIWLQNTAPVWVFLASAYLLREKVRSADWLMLVFGLAGVGLILRYEIAGQQLAGVAFGLSSGVFYAAVVLSIRQLRELDSSWLIALNHIGTAAMLAPLAVYLGLWPSGRQTVLLAGFGILQIGIPYVLFARGLRTVAGHEASAIVLLEPILVPVWVYAAWRTAPGYETPEWWTLAGGALILTGLALRYWGLARRSRRNGRKIADGPSLRGDQSVGRETENGDQQGRPTQ